MDGDRRRLLVAGGALIPALTTGCVGGRPGSSTSGEKPAQASFYLLYDFARNVAGNDVTVESIVPFGQHGHGWDGPTAGQQRDILTSDLFIYMGEGFQPWADNVVETIREDDADVEVVSARDHIDLLDTDDDFGEQDQDEATEHDGGTDHGGDEAEDDHDRDASVQDPHFWLDPQRTGQAVFNIRDGMISVAPENEQAFRERAETYVGELDELHTEFDAVLSDAEKDAVFVAGHNGFRYLGNAYDFETFGLTGISPDEGVSASGRREAEAIIDEYDIEYVLHPVLESRTPAEQLVADTRAKEVLEVTTISGVTDEWVEADMGYVELMRTINLPSFTKALQGG